MATIQLVPGSNILMGRTDSTAPVMYMSTLKSYLDGTTTTSNYSNGTQVESNGRTSASTNNLTTTCNTGTTKTIRFVCYFTADVYTEMSGHSMVVTLEENTGTSVTLDGNIAFNTIYTWSQFSGKITSALLKTGEEIYGFCGSFVVPSNLTGSVVSSLRFRIKLAVSGQSYVMTYLPVYFIGYVNLAAYTYTTAYTIAWNTTGASLGPISPGSSKSITCTLKNNELSNSYAASTSGRIYISTIGFTSTGVPHIIMPNTDGSCWLNKNGTTYPSIVVPVHATGTGSYSSTLSTNASIAADTISGTYVSPQSTKTFTVTVQAPSNVTQRQYYRLALTFKCVGVSSYTTENMLEGYFYSNGVTPSGSYKLRSLSNCRVMDFQTDVENAGSALVISTGTQPILSTNYNANYVGHLAYDGSTATLSPRFKCIDESKTVITANEYVGVSPTPTPEILRTCSWCGNIQGVDSTLTRWICSSCGRTNFVIEDDLVV